MFGASLGYVIYLEPYIFGTASQASFLNHPTAAVSSWISPHHPWIVTNITNNTGIVLQGASLDVGELGALVSSPGLQVLWGMVLVLAVGLSALVFVLMEKALLIPFVSMRAS